MTINEIKASICDNYCKWPFNTETQADLNEHCRECPLNELSDGKPCEDAVSRGIKIGDEVYVHGYVDEIRKDIMIIRNEGGYFSGYKSEVVKELPSVTRQTGEWIETEYHRWRCSVCREKGMSEWDNIHDVRTNFCPNCGSSMKGE